MSERLSRRSSSTSLRSSEELTLRTQESLRAQLQDVKKSTIDFFVPFACERSSTGKLLPPIKESSTLLLKKSISEAPAPQPPVSKPKVAFNSSIVRTKSRVTYDRYPSPPPGIYTPTVKHLTRSPSFNVKRKETQSRFRTTHMRVHSTDFINYDSIMQHRNHITGVDMSKALAREKEPEADIEESLNKMTIRLPDHIR